MQFREILPKYTVDVADEWEKRAEKVLSNFDIQYVEDIHMPEICRCYGIKILPIIDEDKEQLSFSIPTTGRKGIIYIQSGLDHIHKKLLLAEEFCHIYSHHISQLSCSQVYIDKMEAQAKRMAAYLLMPRRFLEPLFVCSDGQPVLIEDIADIFLVTEEFAKFRLELAFKHIVDGFVPINGNVMTVEWIE